MFAEHYILSPACAGKFNNTLKFNSLTLCAFAGSLRLQGGRSKLDGTVEVYLNGVWGTICGNGWDDRDAAVVCRQLGQG